MENSDSEPQRNSRIRDLEASVCVLLGVLGTWLYWYLTTGSPVYTYVLLGIGFFVGVVMLTLFFAGSSLSEIGVENDPLIQFRVSGGLRWVSCALSVALGVVIFNACLYTAQAKLIFVFTKLVITKAEAGPLACQNTAMMAVLLLLIGEMRGWHARMEEARLWIELWLLVALLSTAAFTLFH